MREALAEAPAMPTPAVEENWAEGRLILPGGILDAAGNCHRTVFVRQLTGADEERLAERGYRNGAHQATEFLRHVLVRIEGMEVAISEDLTSGMLIGDRDYLILRLRQMALGDKVEQVLRCFRIGCGRKADVEFLISELPVRRIEAALARYDFTLSEPAFAGDDTSHRGALRLPTGRDHEAILQASQQNPSVANTRLLSRILLRLGRSASPSEEAVRGLALRTRQEIGQFLHAITPGPDLTIDIQCPHCGADMTYPFDLYAFFLPSG
jgi:hypothetical protein